MSRDLSSTVRTMWSTDCYCNCYSSYRRSRQNTHNSTVRYMEIPIVQDVFEVPLFAFNTFVYAVGQNIDSQAAAIVVSLDTMENTPSYVTVDRFMRDVLLERYSTSRLVLLEVKQGNDTLTYYGTQGAVFDRDFNPLMICSYQLERVWTVEANAGEPDKEVVRYKFLQPILRINPNTFLYKESSMERFLVNKLMTNCLENKFNLPYAYNLASGRFISPSNYDDVLMPVKVEICDCPFQIHETETPSISTTNQQLIQTAIDYLDELIQ